MPQIKNSFSNTMRRLSQPSGTQRSQKKKSQGGDGVSKFKWPASIKAAGGQQQQQQKQKKDIKARFSIRKPTHHYRNNNVPHQSGAGTKWRFLRSRAKADAPPSPSSFNLGKAVRWASLSKKKKKTTGKAPAASRPSLLRFRQR